MARPAGSNSQEGDVMNVRYFLPLAAAALSFSLGAAAHASAEVGKPAPALEEKCEEGKTHKIADFKDKVVVLVWTNPGDADGKGGCPFITGRMAAGTFEKQAQAVKEAGGVYVAVNSSHFNTAETSKAVKEKNKLSFPTLIDTDGSMGEAYGARTTPHVIVVGKDGNVVYNGALNDNESTEASKDADAKDYVLDAVKAAVKGEKPAVSETKPYGCSVKYKKKG
jgi:peroxiredoxin